MTCLDCDSTDLRPSGRGRPSLRCKPCQRAYTTERNKDQAMRRRAIKAGAKVVELVRRREVFERDKWICHLCGEIVPERSRKATGTHLGGKSDPLRPVIDHVIALSKGGDHTLDNCKTAHGRCNSRKWNLDGLPSAAVGAVAHVGDPSLACSVEGCPRGVGAYSKGMCRAHHTRVRKTGDPLQATCNCGCGRLVAVAPDVFGPARIDGHGAGGGVAVPLADQLRDRVRLQPVTAHGRDAGLTSDCHIWTGTVGPDGYGTVSYRVAAGERQAHQVHRAAYEAAYGDVSGLVVDHRCRERACLNVEHLEAITHAENLRRGAAVIETCPNGHAYDEANMRQGRRSCKQCHRNRGHVAQFGHDFVIDPSNPSAKRARCLTCKGE